MNAQTFTQEISAAAEAYDVKGDYDDYFIAGARMALESSLVREMRDALEDSMDTIKRQFGNTHPEFTSAYAALAAYAAAVGEK